MKKTNLSYLLIVSLVFLASCAKDGETGPQGPTGMTGNANVQSVTIDVAAADWIELSPVYYKQLSASIITAEIVTTGTVQVFIENNIQSFVWMNLPMLETHSGYFSTYNFHYGVGFVQIVKTNSDNTQTSNPGEQKFKIVAIGG